MTVQEIHAFTKIKSYKMDFVITEILWNSRIFLAYRTEPNQIKHKFAESELFQYFDVFSSSVRSNRTLFYCIWMTLHGVFDAFEWFLWVRFDRTELEKTSKYWKNSIRFDISGKIKSFTVSRSRIGWFYWQVINQ